MVWLLRGAGLRHRRTVSNQSEINNKRTEQSIWEGVSNFSLPL